MSAPSETAAGAEALAAMPAMLRELTECLYLEDGDVRRVAAIQEKLRILALIEVANGPTS